MTSGHSDRPLQNKLERRDGRAVILSFATASIAGSCFCRRVGEGMRDDCVCAMCSLGTSWHNRFYRVCDYEGQVERVCTHDLQRRLEEI